MTVETAKNNNFPPYIDGKLRHVLLYARIGVLAMLDYYGADGLPYQDIKDVLRLPDGSLGPNLAWLKDNGYVESHEERVEGHGIVVYYITQEGRSAYERVKNWLDVLLHHDGLDKGV